MTRLNKMAFDRHCSLISEDIGKDYTKRIYLCNCGFIETLEVGNALTIASYQFGYTEKIVEEKDKNNNVQSLF